MDFLRAVGLAKSEVCLGRITGETGPSRPNLPRTVALRTWTFVFGDHVLLVRRDGYVGFTEIRLDGRCELHMTGSYAPLRCHPISIRDGKENVEVSVSGFSARCRFDGRELEPLRCSSSPRHEKEFTLSLLSHRKIRCEGVEAVVFKLRCQMAGGRVLDTEHRFSEFVALHTLCRSHYPPHLHANFPPAPSKLAFRSGDFAAARTEELQAMLDKMLKLPGMHNNADLKHFVLRSGVRDVRPDMAMEPAPHD